MSGWPGQKVQAPQPTPQRPPAPVFIPNRSAAKDDARADASAGNDAVRTGIAVRGEGRDEAKTGFDQTTTLRKEFEGLPAVQNYKALLPVVMDALSAQEGGTSDSMLIYAYAKMLDPQGAVREGDSDMVQAGQSSLTALQTKIAREFGMDEAGVLSPDKRRELKLRINNRFAEMNGLYNSERDHYGKIAGEFGIDAGKVIGTHAGASFRERYNGLRDKLNGRDAPSRAGLPQSAGFWTAAKSRELWGGDYIGPDGRPLGPDGGQAYDPVTREWVGEFITGQNGPDYRNDPQLREELRQRYRAEGIDPESLATSIGSGFNQMAFGLGDEGAGLLDAAGALLTGKDPVAEYYAGRDSARLAYDDAAQAQPLTTGVANVAGAIGSGFLVPVPNPVAAGAVAGGASAFGNASGLEDSLKEGAVGTLAGAALGKGAEKLAARMSANAAARTSQPLTEGGQVIQAADNLNAAFGTKITPLPADVSGPAIQNVSGKITQMPFSAGQIVGAARRVSDEAQAARDGIAALAGNATSGEQAGETVLTGVQKWMARTKTKVDTLYTKARKLGGDQPVDLAEARQVLDQHIAELSQTPGGAEGLDKLKALRAELDSPYPVEGVKRMRTALRDRFLGDGLRSTDLERRVGTVVDAAESDVVNSLVAAGKADAAKAYSAASAAHAERVTTIDEVIAPFIGRNGEKSPEEVLRAMDAATRVRGGKLGALLKAMPDEDAATVRATLISRLGRATDGQQNAEGTAFSLSRFLTQWNQMSGPAKAELFGGELRAPLEDLAKVAGGTKAAQRFQNHSGTGGVVGLMATGGAATGALIHPATTLLIAGDVLGGKLLSSPRVARWLAKMPSNPAMIEKHLAALTKIAANDNTIAAEISAARTALESALLGGGARRAAAGEEDQGRKTAPTTTPTAPQ